MLPLALMFILFCVVKVQKPQTHCTTEIHFDLYQVFKRFTLLFS